jgi:hypothetical protein
MKEAVILKVSEDENFVSVFYQRLSKRVTKDWTKFKLYKLEPEKKIKEARF